MSLLKKVADLARSPQGRRAIQEAKTRLDTPENRKRVTQAVSRARSSRRPGPSATPGGAGTV